MSKVRQKIFCFLALSGREAKSCGGLPAPEGGPALRPWANVLATVGHLQRLPDEAAEAGVAGSYGPNRPVTQDCDTPATCCPEPSPNLSSSLFLSLFVLVQDDTENISVKSARRRNLLDACAAKSVDDPANGGVVCMMCAGDMSPMRLEDEDGMHGGGAGGRLSDLSHLKSLDPVVARWSSQQIAAWYRMCDACVFDCRLIPHDAMRWRCDECDSVMSATSVRWCALLRAAPLPLPLPSLPLPMETSAEPNAQARAR